MGLVDGSIKFFDKPESYLCLDASIETRSKFWGDWKFSKYWSRFWVRDIFTRIEQRGEFHWLVQELKLGLCRKDKSIYVPFQQEFLRLVKTAFFYIFQKVYRFLFFLINVFSFPLFIFLQAEYQAEKKHVLKIFSRRLAVFFNRAGKSFFFYFKPEILIDFNWSYVTGLMTHCRFTLEPRDFDQF